MSLPLHLNWTYISHVRTRGAALGQPGMKLCQVTVALHTDIATFSWIAIAPWAGLSLDGYPNLSEWVQRMESRKAVLDGMDVPNPNPLKDVMGNPEKIKQLIAAAQSMMVSTKGKGD